MSYLEIAKRALAERQAQALTPPPGPAAEDRGARAGRSMEPLLAMPLDRFAVAGLPVEVRVPWLDVTLWFVPDTAHAAALIAEGISGGRIWTARELADFLALPNRPREAVRTVALAKLAMDGEVVEVRRR